jgi:hypothetical protein
MPTLTSSTQIPPDGLTVHVVDVRWRAEPRLVTKPAPTGTPGVYVSVRPVGHHEMCVVVRRRDRPDTPSTFLHEWDHIPAATWVHTVAPTIHDILHPPSPVEPRRQPTDRDTKWIKIALWLIARHLAR